MPRRRLTADERALWRLATSDVLPLVDPAPADVAADQPAAPPPQPAAPVPRLAIARAPAKAAAPPMPELAAGQAAGLDRRRLDRLKQGRLQIDAVVDLHGMTQAAAHQRIEHMIVDSAAAGRRCLLVVTGKGAQGGGILRRRLADWLNLPPCRPHVLAFSEAQPEHGGGGAFYVLLRRRR